MVYAFAAACLGWVATSCLLGYLLLRVLDRQQEERVAHRIEVDAQRQENAENARSHRGEIAQLNQARIEEVANLLQRIQAPEQAVVSHLAENAPADPPPVDLDDDLALIGNYEERLGNFAAELGAR